MKHARLNSLGCFLIFHTTLTLKTFIWLDHVASHSDTLRWGSIMCNNNNARAETDQQKREDRWSAANTRRMCQKLQPMKSSLHNPDLCVKPATNHRLQHNPDPCTRCIASRFQFVTPSYKKDRKSVRVIRATGKEVRDGPYNPPL